MAAALWSVDERPLLAEILAAAEERIRDEIDWVLACGAALEAWPEYRRPDPFGNAVEADRKAAAGAPALTGARGGYVSCHKHFAGRVPRTDYRITAAGRRALEEYLEEMEELIRATRKIAD